MTITKRQTADQEKKRAALISVLAAVSLTVLKTTVGILTSSLGILAEAAHSGLDLIAALVTFLAVRLSGKPADEEHLYGHGKIENLSALFETFLLLATCVWIIYEAIQRLFFKSIEIEVSFWAFFVMVISIIVNFINSRILYRAARKHHSQALEADALHFNTDIWSSSVVILGLFFVKISEWVPSLSSFHKADSIAALGVALIVVYVSLELGLRTVKALLDTAPQGSVKRIKSAIEKLPGVANVHAVRVRLSGPQVFVDAHVFLDGSQSLEEAHALTEVIEKTIQNIIPHADVIVHPEPAPKSVDTA
jgi:cation diffusion facilitator family transporter